jgi:hypothetical protein
LQRLNPINISPAQLDIGPQYVQQNNGKKVFINGFLTVNNNSQFIIDPQLSVSPVLMH